MFSFLKKTYPYNSFSLKDVITYFIIGCFVTFFLIVFQPFEISIWQTDFKILKLTGFGIVSFVFPLFFKVALGIILKKSVPEESWKVWQEILALILLLIFIAIGNLCYSNFIRIAHIEFEQFFFAVLATILLGIFPVFASVALNYNRYLVLNQKDAKLIETQVIKFQQRDEVQISEHIVSETKPNQPLILFSENEKDKIELRADDLLYIESTDNYSNVVYLKQHIVTKQLIRGSLKRFESQISFPYIIRCHRTYIVNLKQVNQVKGNAQGYRIEFKSKLNNTIPVSRNYSKALFERLELLK